MFRRRGSAREPSRCEPASPRSAASLLVSWLCGGRLQRSHEALWSIQSRRLKSCSGPPSRLSESGARTVQRASTGSGVAKRYGGNRLADCCPCLEALTPATSGPAAPRVLLIVRCSSGGPHTALRLLPRPNRAWAVRPVAITTPRRSHRSLSDRRPRSPTTRAPRPPSTGLGHPGPGRRPGIRECPVET
jgi:hypothetical protein